MFSSIKGILDPEESRLSGSYQTQARTMQNIEMISNLVLDDTFVSVFSSVHNILLSDCVL